MLTLLALVAYKPKASLRLVGFLVCSAVLLSASFALAGWLTWQAILYLIHASQT
jgi:hypothetical protein